MAEFVSQVTEYWPARTGIHNQPGSRAALKLHWSELGGGVKSNLPRVLFNDQRLYNRKFSHKGHQI